jgi:hypothetical protein
MVLGIVALDEMPVFEPGKGVQANRRADASCPAERLHLWPGLRLVTEKIEEGCRDFLPSGVIL